MMRSSAAEQAINLANDTDDSDNLPPDDLSLPSPRITPEDLSLRKEASSAKGGKRTSAETSSAKNPRMKTDSTSKTASKAMPKQPINRPASYKQAAEECRDSGARLQPPPAKVPPVDMSKVIKPKAMPTPPPDYRPEHLKLMLTPRTGQPPNSLPPGAKLNFNDIPHVDQPGRDFDQPFGIKDFDRMNGPEKKWFYRYADFFDRIAYNRHPAVGENVFLNRHDRCSDRFAALGNTTVTRKIEEFTKFQPHPILMGFQSDHHFFEEVPPKEYNARVKFHADFAKMYAHSKTLDNNFTLFGDTLLSTRRGSASRQSRWLYYRKLCQRGTTNYIQSRAGGNPYDMPPARSTEEPWLNRAYSEWSSLSKTFETSQVTAQALRHKVSTTQKENGLIYSELLAFDQDFRLYLGYNETLVLVHIIQSSDRLDIAFCTEQEMKTWKGRVPPEHPERWFHNFIFHACHFLLRMQQPCLFVQIPDTPAQLMRMSLPS